MKVGTGEWIKSDYSGQWFYNTSCEWMGWELEDNPECFNPGESHLIYSAEDEGEEYGHPMICREHWADYKAMMSRRNLVIY